MTQLQLPGRSGIACLTDPWVSSEGTGHSFTRRDAPSLRNAFFTTPIGSHSIFGST